jgi:hypothetical protein
MQLVQREMTQYGGPQYRPQRTTHEGLELLEILDMRVSPKL